MSTPQATLYNLQDRINYLCKKFEGYDDEDDIFTQVKEMNLAMWDLMASQQRLENQMNLIIKLLSEKR